MCFMLGLEAFNKATMNGHFVRNGRSLLLE